jgi:archaeal cell division control protein 6
MESHSVQPKKLFDFHTVKIFKDSYVLESDYIPDSLVGRDEEIKAVADMFFPLFRNGRPGHSFIYGPPGSGKTVVLRHVLRQLYSEAGDMINLKYFTVPCKKHNTTTKILSYLLHELGYPETLPKSGVSCGYYYDQFFSYMKKQGQSLTIIFDEIDFLKDDNVLYNFSRSGEFRDLNERQFIHIIGVSNTGEFVKSLDPRVDSSMQRETIVFPPYNNEQLIDILDMRVPLAFYPDVVCKGTVELCAKESAMDEGDARRAIFLLQAAGNFAIKTDCSNVQPGHVMMAFQKVKEDISLQFVLNRTYALEMPKK